MESEPTPVSARWRRIGSALRLKANVLDRIETAILGSPDKCLSHAIVEWLQCGVVWPAKLEVAGGGGS